MADFDVEDISQLDDDSLGKTPKPRYEEDEIYTENSGDFGTSNTDWDSSLNPGSGIAQSNGYGLDDPGQSFGPRLDQTHTLSSKSSSDSEDEDDRETVYSRFDPKVLANSVNPRKYRERYKKKNRAPTPPDVKSIPTQQAETEAKEQEPKSSSKTHTEFWDIFKIISREPKRDDFHMTGRMMVLKVVTYIVLGLLLLVCSVIQKLSLATLVSNTSEFHHTLLLIVICIPYTLIFLTSLWRSLFGNVPFPSRKNVIFVVIIEGLHSVGLSLLTFRVLPEIDVVRGIMLLSCTCITPSLLKPMCSSSQNTNMSTVGKISVFSFDMLSSLMQMSAIPVVVLTEYYINHNNFAENSVKIVEVIAALFLCSFSYWENFVDDRFCGTLSNTNKLQILMLGLKFDLQESRPILYALAAPVKVLITGTLAFYLDDQETKLEWDQFLTFFELLGKEPKLLVAVTFTLMLALSAFIGHFVAYTTCKLQMQIVSFSVPLLLSTPVAVCALYNDCQTHFLLEISSYENRTCDADLLDTWWHLPVAAGWLISVYWIGRHIWFPCQPRLAQLEKLFVNPLYCGILMEQDLILNRRRHTRKIFKVNSEGRIHYRLSFDNVKDTSPEDEVTTGTLPPMVYACGTMWHESRQEMVQLLKSLFRMDKDQYLRKKAVNMFGVEQADVKYYEFEPHIFFDDAFETNADNESVPNSFVNIFVELMEEAASSVHEKVMSISDPIQIPTPYGGQLVYLMPGENFMFVHLKDKTKVRHKKRWSQVMYMYYLLGYRILKECQEVVMTAMKDNAYNDLVSWRHFQRQRTGKVEKSQIFNFLDDEVLYRAQNTFILALDGDVEFTPGAVHLLIDKMKKNDRVGAVCGRIHPTGKGPVVWFQQFEYAVAHWLQKATEHVLGCVLCSPGCFSMFRGSSLMDDNVMRKFTILPTEASHHLMYDQGEDRWLCTLLVQQGYRIDYTAAADVFTHVPEDFGEFFDQRRRWMPSTFANVLELLQDGRNTVAINNSISWLYIVYQSCFHPHEFSCIMHGAMYFLCIPLGFLLLVIYSLCNMHDISWGTREVQKKKTIQETIEEKRLKKERKERNQQGFLSRFMPNMKFADIAEVLKGLKLKNKRKEATTEMLRVMNKNFELLLKLKQSKGRKIDTGVQDIESMPELVFQNDTQHPILKKTVTFDDKEIMQDEHDELEDDIVTPKKKDIDDKIDSHLAKQNKLGNGPILRMNPAEEEFWKILIHRYLYPLEVTAAAQKQIKTRLLELRNSICVAIGIINLIWIAVNFMFQLRKPATIYFEVPSDVDETEVNSETFQVDLLGMLFIIFFGVIILIQFIGMLVHRWGTFLHLVAITDIPNPFKRTVSENDFENENSKFMAKKALEFCERLNSESIQDDAMNSDDEEEEDEKAFRAMAQVINNIQEKGTKNIPGSTNPLGISIRQTGLNASANVGCNLIDRRTGGANSMMRSILRRTAQKESKLLDVREKPVTTSGMDKGTFNDIEKGIPKIRFAVGAPLQKHFMSEVRNRRVPNTPEDFLKKERLSQTLKRGGYNPDTVIDSEEDNDLIYDAIPALGVMDKAFVKKFKKFRLQEKQQRVSTTSHFTNTAYSEHGLY
ncbi:uncharacterized protein LOC110459670 isoform X2 [Mizuhopecten yessoensis]|uniref:uncharacterized protein LOC110459670 isoform X2 n=1 Tax=Mizuhopecten yessoensis TaxID=6573 RepID=UPI000B45BFFD|nr:uncharacterized protein LOC110459670 isoform X2 [Mizuhopecten yessoensis]